MVGKRERNLVICEVSTATICYLDWDLAGVSAGRILVSGHNLQLLLNLSILFLVVSFIKLPIDNRSRSYSFGTCRTTGGAKSSLRELACLGSSSHISVCVIKVDHRVTRIYSREQYVEVGGDGIARSGGRIYEIAQNLAIDVGEPGIGTGILHLRLGNQSRRICFEQNLLVGIGGARISNIYFFSIMPIIVEPIRPYFVGIIDR